MNLWIYNRTTLFYSLSILIPWALWFIASYISHIEAQGTNVQMWASIIAFLGLVAPVIIALFMAMGNRVMIIDLMSRFFNFHGIKTTYIVLTFFLMPISILLAQGVSLLFGYSINQFQLSESFSFTSGVFPV